MGFKTVVVFDNDHIDQMRTNPEDFVQALLSALSKGQGVREVPIRHLGNYSSTIGNVVWCGHVDVSPTMTITDFGAYNISYKH